MKIPTLNLTWLIRYWLGIMMMLHSYEPLFYGGMNGFANYLESLQLPFPLLLAYVSKLGEFIGGLMLIINLKTRIFSGLIISIMLVATFLAHKGRIFTEGELAFNYLLLATILFFNPEVPYKILKR